jgi:hypothetical protein
MSRYPLGSQSWWLETAAIAGAGLVLAVSLWDGPIVEEQQQAAEQALPVAPQPRSVGELMDAGCLTQEHLQAMREGRSVMVECALPTHEQPQTAPRAGTAP